MCAVPPVPELGEDHGELAIANRGARCGDIERASQPDGAGEAAELALHQVIGLVGAHHSGRLFTGNDQNARPEDDAQGLRGDARDVDDDLDGGLCFQHIERGVAFAREGALFALERSRKVLEELADVLGKLPGLPGGEERGLWHRVPMFSQGSVLTGFGRGCELSPSE